MSFAMLLGIAFILVGLFGALLRVLDAADTVAEAKWIARHQYPEQNND